MQSVELEQFRDEVNRLAAIIAAPAELLPTYRISDGSGRPHVELDGTQFHFVIAERGEEIERHSSADPDDTLFRVFETIAFSMAVKYEGRHRKHREDFRRQLFAVQLQLLGQLSERWQSRTRSRLDEVLSRHPFNDNIS